MHNIKLLLEYDGTNFVGWQRQQRGRSVQGELESVLSQILQQQINVIGAGRTDAGVHARGQVANFRSDSRLGVHDIHGGLGGLLPADIVIHAVEEVPLDFHARYSAKERFYSYSITLEPSALLRNYSWYVKYRLDEQRIQKTAKILLGQHDFESFCKANSEVDHYRCIVSHSCWVIPQSGTTMRYEIRANRFLHGMVRALVGTMVDVGRGYTTPDEFLNILDKKDRKEAGMTAPAHGLVLESVVY